jgi:hypothetical protein
MLTRLIIRAVPVKKDDVVVERWWLQLEVEVNKAANVNIDTGIVRSLDFRVALTALPAEARLHHVGHIFVW